MHEINKAHGEEGGGVRKYMEEEQFTTLTILAILFAHRCPNNIVYFVPVLMNAYTIAIDYMHLQCI